MRLSVESLDFVQKYGEVGAVKALKDVGFECVDWSCYNEATPNSILFGDDYLDRAYRIREALDKEGLVCNQSHTPFVILPENYVKSLDDWRYRDLIRSMEFAAVLGAPHTVIHCLGNGWYEGFWENAVQYYKDLLPWCEKFNIKMAIENLWSYDKRHGHIVGKRLSTPEELTKMIEAVNSPYATGLIDVGHAALSYDEAENFILGMDGRLVEGLHVHDTDLKSDTHILPYLGKQHWSEIMNSLAAIGYKGDLTFEIDPYFRGMDDGNLINAAEFAVKTGRHLIDLFEQAKQA